MANANLVATAKQAAQCWRLKVTIASRRTSTRGSFGLSEAIVIFCLSVSAAARSPRFTRCDLTGAHLQQAGVLSGAVQWCRTLLCSSYAVASLLRGCLSKYPYPVATAFLQLALVSLFLALVNTIGHLCCSRWRTMAHGMRQEPKDGVLDLRASLQIQAEACRSAS